MQHFEMHTQPQAPFYTRIVRSLRLPVAVTIVMASIIFGFKALFKQMPEVQAIIPIGDGILFMIAVYVQYNLARAEERYFMTDLIIKEDEIVIQYLVEDTPKSISGKPEDFIFEKKGTLGRSGSSYQSSILEIYYDKRLKVKQYVSGEWTDMKFIEVMQALKNIGIPAHSDNDEGGSF